MPLEPFDRCIYCGSDRFITADHVPPACIFPEPRPSNLPTVPACQDCNRSFGRDDEYFRDALAIAAYDKDSAKPLAGKFFRSLRRTEAPRYKAGFFESMRDGDLRTPAGLYLGRSTICDVDGARILNVVKRTIRGLFFWTERNPVPTEEVVAVYESTSVSLQAPQLVPTLKAIAQAVLEAPGNGQDFGPVFSYKYAFLAEEELPYSTWWLLRFHRRMLFVGRIGKILT